MLPHANMGIRFRTYFEPIGFSRRRSANKLRREILALERAVKDRRLSPEIAQPGIDELRDLISKTKRK